MRIKERYELALELRDRYWAARREERGQMLDGYCLATGYNRKYAIEMLRDRRRKPRLTNRPRRRRYGQEFQRALKVLWESSDYICSERLQPFLPDLAKLLERHGQIEISPETAALLEDVSIATVERNLRPLRRGLITRRMSQTKPGTLLRKEVPVVVGKWRDLDQPGYLEVDGVSHSGEIAAGEWIWTISATDLSTGWTERVPVMGRGQLGVLAAVKRIREQLPFELLGIHPDNGNEFLNWHLIKWCRDEKILISRSRPEHKNDNAHVEQKNWTLVRKLIGYERLDTPTQLEWLDRLYTDLLRPYNNCFQPVMKLLAKEHDVAGHLRKRYDTPTTPLRRLLDSGVADPAKVKSLVELYTAVSPLTLKRRIDRRLAAMPAALEVAASA